MLDGLATRIDDTQASLCLDDADARQRHADVRQARAGGAVNTSS